MVPKPKRSSDTPLAYPTRRDFIRRFGLAAVGAAIGVAAVGCDRNVGPPGVPPQLGGEVAVDPNGPPTFCAETCGKEIDAQIALLRSTDPNVRKKASAELIKIAKADGETEDVARQKRALVIAKVKELESGEDPQVAQLAAAIIKEIGPSDGKDVPKDPIPLGGKPRP